MQPPANQRAVRRHNLGVVLRHVVEHGPRSRATIALDALAAQGATPAGIAVALPGLVDAASGALLVAPNLHWEDIPVVEELATRLGGELPIAADNEANLAAVAELHEGAGRGLRDFV